MSFFSDVYVDALRNSPLDGAIDVCSRALSHTECDPMRGPEDVYSDASVLVEALALVKEMERAGLIGFDAVAPDIRGEANSDYRTIREFLHRVLTDLSEQQAQHKFQLLSQRFSIQLGGTFAYEFSKGDQNRIQELLNELRDFVSSSDQFESEHKQRLLRRLEALQAEVHKKVSDLDRFWGMVGDAGVAVGKFGTDAKPFVDRIRELTGIIWRTQARAEELPSDAESPLLLGGPDDEA